MPAREDYLAGRVLPPFGFLLFPNNTTIIRNLGEFPDPVAGDIQLADNTFYQIEGNIDIEDNRLLMGVNTVLQGRTFGQAGLDSITSNNATEVVLQDSGNLFLRLLSVTQTGAGTAARVDFAAGFHFAERVTFTGALVLAAGPTSLNFVSTVGDGIVVESTFAQGLGFCNGAFINTDAGQACVDIQAGAVVTAMNILNTGFGTVAGSFGLRVDDPAQVGDARIENGIFSGAGTFLSGLTVGDNTWKFRNNIGLQDSADQGVTVFSGAPVTINLLAAQAWVDIADGGASITYVLQPGAQKFALTDADNGELTYTDGLTGGTYGIGVSVTFTRAGAPDIAVEFGISIDGAAPVLGIAATAFAETVTVTIPMLVESLVNAQTIKVQARNIDGSNPADDIDVSQVVLSIWG